MKTPTHFAALSELTARDFKKQAVITPKRRFGIYDDGQSSNVINWSSEYQTHIYLRLNVSCVDKKPHNFASSVSGADHFNNQQASNQIV
ncbi:hypothetical protein [Vibrio tapetis]|uniref:Uncharacterized protein n=1 Tax=Vibrio tapetis subsp. tapetis TaxID=1671868 RepID=A0A2N8ZI96_9VIBR|nr:hypothetical protein [Vibrio tapetis]SON51635.1 conserved protein of unknown function [Vibrio tapetis subsp. tapetis]